VPSRHSVSALLLLLGVPSLAHAQHPWSVAIGGGAAGFGGASKAIESFPGAVSQFKPSPTTRLHIAAGRRLGARLAVNAEFSYSKAGLTGYGSEQSITFNPAITLYDVRLLASYDLFHFGQDSRLAIAAGPMLQHWSGDAIIDAKTEIGGAAALTLFTPLSGPLGLLVSGSLAVAGSPLDANNLQDLNETFETVAIWTRELVVGLRYSF
jgi:hypothetical protein